MIKRISYIIISLALLITTMGLTINLHYCAGNLYSVAIDSENNNCCEDNNHKTHMNNSEQNNQCHIEEPQNNHCNDETVLVKIDDYFTTTTENINTNINDTIVLYAFTGIFNIFTYEVTSTSILNDNDSPPYSRQIFSFLQVFLF
ncbi:MAG: hypothetical protein GXO79_15265 [Chlorobi bacterium]|nr:hypothetical protein [Chlorobiota bacterium]